MVEYQRLDKVFAALADPTRRALLHRLAGGSRTVTELARPHRTSLNAISKHLKVLEAAGLVHRQVAGREHHLSMRSDALTDATEWLRYHQQFWTRSLDALAELVEAPAASPPKEKRNATSPGRARRRHGR